MGSTVLPYFILNAEKITDVKELADIQQDHLRNSFSTPKAPPITPVPSGVSHPSDVSQAEEPICLVRNTQKHKKLLRFKIPVRTIHKRSSLNTRMELIKEKLEKSRQRFKQKKDTSLIHGTADNCVPTVIGLNGDPEAPFGLDRSTSDHTGVKGKKNADGTFPYVYFVVTDNKIAEGDEDFNFEGEDNIKSKSAKKKKRVKIVDENKNKRDKKEQMAKMKGLARELGLKSNIDPKAPESTNDKPRASVNHIVFPDTIPEHPKSKHANELPVTRSSLRSPPRMTLSTTYLPDTEDEGHEPDVDEDVPRKPFLSRPLYTGKNRGFHSCALQTFELPDISPEQKRRALGLGSSTNFDEFAYPKPRSDLKDRKVSFADQLPVIRGSGFVVSGNESRDPTGLEPLNLGPRAATMGSITLPSERVDKRSLCQRFLLNEHVSSARTMRRNGVPLPLPKIDIVSSVYDEMIIKMIQEYLQVSNTPSRQSQLAKELLVHLQKHNENMKEMNVPMVKVKRESALRAELESAHMRQKMARDALFGEMDVYPPPNTAEAVRRPLTEEEETIIPENKESATEQEEPVEENQMPVVEVTIRNKNVDENEIGDDQTNVDSDGLIPRSAIGSRGLKSRERPAMSQLTPISFQMAPPGLSKEDTNHSTVSVKS